MLLAITGNSAAGKTHVATALPQIEFSMMVSHTIRQQRKGELEGFDYYFLEKAEFQEKVHRSEFVEVDSFCGAMYGLSWAELDQAIASGRVPVHVCTPAGVTALAKQAEKLSLPLVSVYIKADDRTLVFRMLKRWHLDSRADPGYLAQRVMYGLFVEPRWSGDFNYILPSSDCLADLIGDLRSCRKDTLSIPPVQLKEGINRVGSEQIVELITSLLLKSGRPTSINGCDQLTDQVLDQLSGFLSPVSS